MKWSRMHTMRFATLSACKKTWSRRHMAIRLDLIDGLVVNREISLRHSC